MTSMRAPSEEIRSKIKSIPGPRIPSLPEILSNSKKEFAKTVSVPKCQEHPSGFTIYKIVIQVVPRNSLEEDAAKFIAWRRYRDLFKLWQKLSVAHHQLHLHGSFPDFPKPKLFGKSDPGTVSERKESTEAFLDFAVKDPVLGRLPAVQEFFSEGITIEDDLNSSKLDPALKPTSAAFPLCDFSVDQTEKEEEVMEPSQASLQEPNTSASVMAIKNMEAEKRETLAPTPLDSDETSMSQNSDLHSEMSSTVPDTDVSFSDPFKSPEVVVVEPEPEIAGPSNAKGDSEQSDKWLMDSMRELRNTESANFDIDHFTTGEIGNADRNFSVENSETQKSAHYDEFGDFVWEKSSKVDNYCTLSSSESFPLFAIEDCSLPTPIESSEFVGDSNFVEIRKEDEICRKSAAPVPSVGETPELRPEHSHSRTHGSSNEARDPAELEFEHRRTHSEKESLTSKIARFFPKMGVMGNTGASSSHGIQSRRRLEAETVVSHVGLVPPGAGLKQVRSEGNFLSMVAGLDSESPERTEPAKESISDKIVKRAFGAQHLKSEARKSRISPNRRVPRSRSRGNSGGKIYDDDYLIQAAHFISSAQKSEAEGAYDLAFSCYKSAVNLLLQGVQAEKDLARRNAVRKKTAKYLVKAERIYRNYLAFDSSTFDVKKWTADFAVTSPSVQDPTLIPFQGSYGELKQYKFLKRLARGVQLVEITEKNVSEEKEQFALKFLDKTWNNTNLNLMAVAENFVPINVPYMVHLVKFYETEKSVILLLEYALKGGLWNFLAQYFDRKRRETDPAKFEELKELESKARDRSPPGKIGDRARNRYVGRSISFSVGELIGLSEELEEVLKELDCGGEEPGSAFRQVLLKKSSGGGSAGKLKSLRNTRDKKMRDSLGSIDSLSIDTVTNQYLPSSSGSATGVSPNPELRFQNVFTKISAEIGDFSIEEEVGVEKPTDSNKLCAELHVETAEEAEVELEPAPEVELVAPRAEANEGMGNEEKAEEMEGRDGDGEEWRTSKELESSGLAMIDNTNDVITFDKWMSKNIDQTLEIELPNCAKVKDLLESVKWMEEWPADKEPGELLVKIWVAQLLLALAHLHAEGVVVKDLSPRNLLLGGHGQLLLTYCSEWSCVDKATDFQAVSELYSAPEVGSIQYDVITDPCDWWSVGTLLYELLTGWPLHIQCPQGIISRSSIPFLSKSPPSKPSPTDPKLPEDHQVMSQSAQDLLERLLMTNPKERLGQDPGGVEEIRSHTFFRNVPWQIIDPSNNPKLG